MKLQKFFLVIGAFLFLSSHFLCKNLYALNVEEAFQQLKDIPMDLQNSDGPLCEKLVELILREENPYLEVFSNVEYAVDSEISETNGELDLVLFDQKKERVFQILEIKCKKSHGSMKVAQQQIQRYKAFEKQMLKNNLELHYSSNGELIPSSYFKHRTSFEPAFLGTQEFPFYEQARKELSNRLKKCQNDGQCPKPYRNKHK